ncbi:MAG: hypothetical protein ABH842_05630 [Candidatus Micrarchaeota archaeon]
MSRYIFTALLLLFGCITTTHQQNTTQQSNITMPNCTDSDGGANIFIKGSLGSYTDFCENNSLTEYFCYNDTVNFETMTCPNGTVCTDGACIINIVQDNRTIEDFCIDSDGGANVYVSGFVTSQNETYRDSCNSQTSVLEYLCDGGKMMNSVISCGIGNSCQENACVNASRTCTETDEEDEYELGKIVQSAQGLVLQSKYDSCFDNTTIREYYCNGSEINSKTLPCNTDEICSGGRCISVCLDGDDGIDVYNASYVKDLTQVYNDYCYDKYTLVDYTCDGGLSIPNYETCEIICKNGRCYDSDNVTCEETNSGRTVKLHTSTSTLDSATDSCLDYMTKKDYQCVDSKIEYEEVECKSDEFCYSGKCYEITAESCYDIDSGAYYNGRRTASYIILTSSSSIEDVKYDYCTSNTMVAEYSCSGTKTAIDFYECMENAECIDGACVYPYTCIDSHLNSSTFGSVSFYQNGTVVSTEYDTCASDIVVRRVSCTFEDGIEYTLMECTNGTVCNNGSCD